MSSPPPQQRPAPRHSPRDGSDEPHPDRWRALAVTLLVGFMSLLDVTIVNVAVPSIQRGLGASSAQIQWIVSGYALTFGLTLVAGGRLGDVVGRRRMFLVGLVAFTLTSAAAGLAPDARLLVVARLLQGAAAGLLTPQNTGLIQQLFTGAERGRAFGVFGTTVGLSAATGPILGGLILAAFGQDDGWRYVFFVNVPIGVVAMVLAMRLLPRAGPRKGSVHSQIDGVGRCCSVSPCSRCCCRSSRRWPAPASPLWLLALLAPCSVVLRALGAPGHTAGCGAVLDVLLFAQAPGFGWGSCSVDVLLRVRGCLAGAGALPPGRSRVHPAAVRARRHPVRDRLRGRVRAGRAGGRAAGPTGDGVRAVAGGGRLRGDCSGGAAHLAVAPGPLAVGATGGGGGRRWGGDLAEHHDDAGVGAAADGRGGRWRAADRPADRHRGRGGRAGGRLPADPGPGAGVGAGVSAAFTVALAFSLVALVMGLRELRLRPDLGDAAPAHA